MSLGIAFRFVVLEEIRKVPLIFTRLSAFGHRENVIEAVERIKKNLKQD